ncbi:MAG: hypothetical protein U5M23_04570 [Marinagarivorans sp.]|nr:hypothetical protein [Marinagarivorans sp.]
MCKLIYGVVSVLVLLSQSVYAEHKVSVGYGSATFNWDEFKENINGSIGFLNSEEGDLQQLDLSYTYNLPSRQNIAVTFSNLSNGVDYRGLPVSGSGSVGYTVTDYDMQQLTIEYGAWFIKSYAAILGGYHQRERIINASNDFENRLAEKYTYYFLGALLEAEVFSWNGVSLDIGGQFSYSAEGEVHLIDSDTDIPLESINGISYFARVNYEFFPSWEVSLKVLKNSAKMDKSNVGKRKGVADDGTVYTQDVFQPESEQTMSYIGLSLSKVF